MARISNRWLRGSADTFDKILVVYALYTPPVTYSRENIHVFGLWLDKNGHFVRCLDNGLCTQSFWRRIFLLKCDHSSTIEVELSFCMHWLLYWATSYIKVNFTIKNAVLGLHSTISYIWSIQIKVNLWLAFSMIHTYRWVSARKP